MIWRILPGPKSIRGLPVWFLNVLLTILPWRQATLIPLWEMKSTVFPGEIESRIDSTKQKLPHRTII